MTGSRSNNGSRGYRWSLSSIAEDALFDRIQNGALRVNFEERRLCLVSITVDPLDLKSAANKIANTVSNFWIDCIAALGYLISEVAKWPNPALNLVLCFPC